MAIGYRNCPSLRNALKNGYVKLRSYPNRVARFTCNKGYDLIGNRYSTCSRNHWTHDLPVCVCKCFFFFVFIHCKRINLSSGNNIIIQQHIVQIN